MDNPAEHRHAIDAITRELAELWTALAPALPRDTASNNPGAHGFTAATPFNLDVLTTMATLDREIPQACRSACETLGEPWQPRDLTTHLRALPRLASRLDNTGHVAHTKRLEHDTAAWLRLTKRALGLRRPDIPIGYACPHAEDWPDLHTGTCMLYAAGDEGFLRPGDSGLRVEWIAGAMIYCPAPDCDGAWGPPEWPLLGRMLTSAPVAS